MRYYRIKSRKGNSYQGASEGNTTSVTEPIARTLIASGVAEEVDKLPPVTKASEGGTKRVSAAKVAHKVG